MMGGLRKEREKNDNNSPRPSAIYLDHAPFSADDLDLEEVIFIGFWVKIDKNSFLTTPTFDLDLLSDDLDL